VEPFQFFIITGASRCAFNEEFTAVGFAGYLLRSAADFAFWKSIFSQKRRKKFG
jgi:hypothetical protein